MQRLVAFTLAACLLAGIINLVAVAKDPTAPKEASGNSPATGPEKTGTNTFIVGAPVRFKNLSVFPVASSIPRNEDRFLTLDEGLRAGTVQVFEIGSQVAASGATAQPQGNRPAAQQGRTRSVQANESADNPFGDSSNEGPEVNRLMVINKSDKPLYLMPGEIIYGGQQDRTVAVEAIIEPGKKPVAVDVFCVEQGRWTARTISETARAVTCLAAAADQVPDTKAREKYAEDAKHGKFVVPAGSLTKAGRAAVQGGKGQEEVWKKVEEANAASSNDSPSSDFVANYTNPQVIKQLQTYMEALQAPVANQRQVVGAIVAVNGKVEAVDVFQSTPLFCKLWPKLLKSYALDASAVAGKPEASKEATLTDARKFLHTAMEATVAKKSDSPGGLVVTKRDSEEIESFSAGMKAMGGMGGGGFGDAVHSSGYKK